MDFYMEKHESDMLKEMMASNHSIAALMKIASEYSGQFHFAFMPKAQQAITTGDLSKLMNLASKGNIVYLIDGMTSNDEQSGRAIGTAFDMDGANTGSGSAGGSSSVQSLMQPFQQAGSQGLQALQGIGQNNPFSKLFEQADKAAEQLGKSVEQIVKEATHASGAGDMSHTTSHDTNHDTSHDGKHDSNHEHEHSRGGVHEFDPNQQIHVDHVIVQAHPNPSVGTGSIAALDGGVDAEAPNTPPVEEQYRAKMNW